MVLHAVNSNEFLCSEVMAAAGHSVLLTRVANAVRDYNNNWYLGGSAIVDDNNIDAQADIKLQGRYVPHGCKVKTDIMEYLIKLSSWLRFCSHILYFIKWLTTYTVHCLHMCFFLNYYRRNFTQTHWANNKSLKYVLSKLCVSMPPLSLEATYCSSGLICKMLSI